MTEPTPLSAPESTPSSTPSSNRGIMIVLAYLWILALVPLLTEKEDQEVRWHAKHGVVLMVAEIAIWIVLMILMAMPLLGLLLLAVSPLVSLLFVVLHVVCIIKGLNGQRFTIPFVSQYADKF
jgi:uncharacterized membrane protein